MDPPPVQPPTLVTATEMADDVAADAVVAVVAAGAAIVYDNYLNRRIFSYTAHRVGADVLELASVIELARRNQCAFHDGGVNADEGRAQDVDLWARKMTPMKPMTASNHGPLSPSRASTAASHHSAEPGGVVAPAANGIETQSVGSSSATSPRRQVSMQASPNKKRIVKEAQVVHVPEPECPADVRLAEASRRQALLRLLQEAATPPEDDAPLKPAPERRRAPVPTKKKRPNTLSCTTAPAAIDPADDAVLIEFNVSDIGDTRVPSRRRHSTRQHVTATHDRPRPSISVPSIAEQRSFRENAQMRIPENALHSVESLAPVPGVKVRYPSRDEDSRPLSARSAEMPAITANGSSAKDGETRAATAQSCASSAGKRTTTREAACNPSTGVGTSASTLWKPKKTKIQDRQTQPIPVTRKQPQRSHPQYIIVQECSPPTRACQVVRVVSPPKPTKPPSQTTASPLICRRTKLK
ncbi:hypothetical protein SPRG_03572 [Saprolegnia parasitica CBS 223.65]|uniref:Uncharacterized protein n=1 Tax=Saprolegnia parasitica (strain CBS 223.65) TaxID=695850 RepID=A0A067CXZ0_SAPPC|nr:hypothetical protein SPRG_03572 [Saprolegnia parasitica CBS 223.65]KDO31652.1 hypothetical protein SPRG_03572 [Saprolegnia parasitica CBS 223.65]|eukprot:XP_012197542.1 hypothetical protein SPRG_03572 [Saprolegnia parasitica CBS 223.65]